MQTAVRHFALLILIAIALLMGCGGSSPANYTVDSLSPSEVVAGSADFVLLVSGSNFKASTKVLFAGQTITPNNITSTSLQVLVPSSAVKEAAVVDVAVTGSSTSAALKFTIKNPSPSISALSPLQVPLNSTAVSLDITGNNFVSTSVASFGDTVVKPSSVTPTKLTVVVPDALLTTAQVMNVAVTNPSPGGGTSKAVDFAVLNPAPTITALSMSETLLNSTAVSLSVTGTNFLPSTVAKLGDVLIKPTLVAPTKLTLAVPDALLTSAKVMNLVVANPSPGGGTSSALNFTVLNPAPTIAALSMQEVQLNSTSVSVDITGTNFVSTSLAKFGDVLVQPSFITPNRLTVAVPDTLLTAAKVMDLAVINPSPGGGTSGPLNFTVLNPVPVITALSAEEALLNSTDLELVITGTGFAPGMKIDFGPTSLDFAEITPTRASVIIPKSAFGKSAIHKVTVSNSGPGGGVSNAHQFTVKNPTPSLASLSIAKVLVGSDDLTLSLNGTGFVSGESVIHFGGLTLAPSSATSDQLSVVIPKDALATSGTFLVDVLTSEPGGGRSNTLEFSVQNPTPTLLALAPENISAGSGAFDLILTGSNFVPMSSGRFGDTQPASTVNSNTQITMTIPAEMLIDGGQHEVTVSSPGPGGGSSNALAFLVNNPAPTISAVSPTTAIRLSSDTTLTLTGTGFVHQSSVQLGAVALTPASYTPTEITVLIPSSAISRSGPVDVTVVNPGPGGGTSGAVQITVANPRPHSSSTLPSSLTTSTSDVTLVLNGTGFNEDTVVTMTTSLGDLVLTPISIEPTAISVPIPSTDLANPGALVLTASNPEPGGGPSEPLTIRVRERASTEWRRVVDNKMNIPGLTGRFFNSYNQPSVSNGGLVVFKGQSQGESGPIVGVFLRDMSGAGHSIRQLTTNGMAVPQPNNTLYNGVPAGFNQFPSFTRIDMETGNVVFRGQSKPTWTFTTADGLESRIGSAGIFTDAGGGGLKTGVGLLGTVPDFEFMKVPSEGGTRFDQFPGSPAILGNTIIFKGNYTVGDLGKTGVYFRDVVADEGKSPVQRIADSDTIIPNQPGGGTVPFASTAPPSAANGNVVFVGLDNEDAPTLGGIYMAPLQPNPPLRTLVDVGPGGTQVPGEAPGVRFTHLGEGLSFDGRYVSFWGAWGTETRTRTLICGTDGNTDMLADCTSRYPNGFEVQIPIHQGIFVYDTNGDGQLNAIVKTDTGEFTDFLYWVFSGRPPNVGDSSGGSGDGTGDDVVPEPPRWRSSPFVAVAGTPGMPDLYKVTFRASAGNVNGIYLAQSSDLSRIQTVLETTFQGIDIDAEDAPAGSYISTVGMERDGLRSDQLVISTSMLNSTTTESNAGIYITPVRPLVPRP